MQAINFWATFLIPFIAVLVFWRLTRRRRMLNLPPGPPSHPILGHLLAIPTKEQGRAFHEWSKTYGDVIYLHCLGRSMVVLNSVEAATELLEKRGAIYSCRPTFTFFALMGWEPNIGFMRYGHRFLKHRKIFQRHFSRQESTAYQDIQVAQVGKLLQALAHKPDDYDHIFGRFSAAIIVKIVFGHELQDENDTFMHYVDQLRTVMNNSGAPGNTLVDLFPSIQYWPKWFPGTSSSNYARKWRWLVRKLHDVPYDMVKESTAHESPEKSVLALELEEMTLEDPDHLEDIKSISGAALSAGSDTTWSTINVFLLAMLRYPEVVRKGQAELDNIVGQDRLPDFTDRELLPYIECILQECLRWQTVVPLGLPHRVTEDDVYRGMLIPKDSIVFANIYGFALDDHTYKDPHEFRPERFLPQPSGAGEPHFTSAWGFGRRICPGRFLADASVWLAIATILSTFEISRRIGSDGEAIIPPIVFHDGLARHPEIGPCDIRVRSAKAMSLISQA
ncbi:cytochrome P450 [Mycena floridula]|nr:cytochrome P450 [Mycena floridula]